MTRPLLDDVAARLDTDGALADPCRDLVLAALLGELDATLAGSAVTRPAPPPPLPLPLPRPLAPSLPRLARSLARPAPAPATGPPPTPQRAYVRALTVEGFRGIGPRCRLELASGPGLTLVIGRNGCGKSSFSEALELLLTGDNQRWSERRNKAWRDGWKNLHHDGPVMIRAELLVDGRPGELTITRRWTGDDLAAGETSLTSPGDGLSRLEDLGWTDALQAYRPFLSYNELGSMLEHGPSRLHDTLSAVLGLDELSAASERLKEARKGLEQSLKQAKERLAPILRAIGELEDERAARCAAALSGRKWDLDAVEAATLGDNTAGDDGTGALLDELARITAPALPAIESVAADLRAALARRDALRGTDADRARRLAGLLRQALSLHTPTDATQDCPVCRTSGVLDAAWHRRTEEEAAALEAQAADAGAAHAALGTAERSARALLAFAAPTGLDRAEAAGIPAELVVAARAAREQWGRAPADLADLPSHLEAAGLTLTAASDDLRQAAALRRQERQEAWRPLARQLAVWLPLAHESLAAAPQIADLKQAEKWLAAATTDLRNERFAPVKEQVRALWETLRTNSHVSLDDLDFAGTATQRRLEIGVSVDGHAAVALGVMSQGELHSLALSLFLPRATLPQSPFGFLFIDDPVQAMDPAKVEGLARALADTARDRQVVVFTHDDRLPEAVRRLAIPATVLEVLRRAASHVEVRAIGDPASRCFADARAVALTQDLPPEVAQRVVPGLCRQGIEAACIATVRRRRLGRGEPHRAVEELLETHTKLLPRLALALFDDAERAGDVYGHVDNKGGHRAADAVRTCNEGAHGKALGDAMQLIGECERLAKAVGGVK